MSPLLIAAAGAALVAQADQANERYVSCMFAVAREQPRGLSADELVAVLRSACVQEREASHVSTIAVQRQRGTTPPEAEAAWNTLVEQAIANIASARARVRTAAR